MTGLLTDLYELNMAVSYLRRGMAGPATFSLFVRRLPPERGFLVAAGVERALDFLEQVRFDADDLAYLHDALGFDAETLARFARLRFTGDVWAIPEGTVVGAGEPLVEVTAPIAEAQLVETYVLNRVTFETAIATKAARCVLAARGRELVEFGFRRTQGIEAGIDVARLAVLTGFAATSNVEAARRFGLRAAGTMAHSFVEAFPDEAAAFRAFAEDNPGRLTFLVDTFDTLRGVRHAIEVIRALHLGGRLGIRLDSGDLGALAESARELLDDAGLEAVQIFASGGLDEYAIDELLGAGAPIDAFGLGTKLGVSADRPYLDSAYKLVQYGDRPVMKLSPGKINPPGPKQVFRASSPALDVVGTREEAAPEGMRPLLEPVMLGGRRLRPRPTLAEWQERHRRSIAELPPRARALRDAEPVPVELSPRLAALLETTRAAVAVGGG